MALRNYLQRLGGFAASAIESNLVDLDLPYRLFLYVTDACNCKCNMCSIWQKPTDGELTTPELIRILDNARNHVKWMDVSGGEIFMRDDILGLFEHIANELPHLLMFHFATNGLLTKRIVECAQVINRSDIPHFIITISLDGPPELHEEIRGIPGIWSRCMQTFKELKALGGKVEVVFGMTLTEHNHDQYEATFEAVKKEVPQISHRDFHVNIAQVSDLYYGNRELIHPPYQAILQTVHQVAKLRGQSLHPVNYLEYSFLKNASKYIDHNVSPMLCEALSASCVIGPRGDLFPCVMWEASSGNLREHGYSISSIWQTAKRKEVRDQIRQGKCPQCWTPCEAYQSVIANALPLGKNRRNPPAFLNEVG